jgi:hypothetical protein
MCAHCRRGAHAQLCLAWLLAATCGCPCLAVLGLAEGFPDVTAPDDVDQLQEVA